MKISKLFHWLYALVMLLPIFAIGSAILISTFNMNTKRDTEISYRYQSKSVNSNSDLISNNIYLFECSSYELLAADNEFYLNVIDIYDTNFSDELNEVDEVYYSNIIHDGDFIALFYSGYISFYNGRDSYTSFIIQQQSLYIKALVVVDYLEVVDNSFYTFFSEVDETYIPIDSVMTYDLNYQDVFYDSVEKVTQSQLFSWSYDSFLVAPFSYIVNLFGMPTNSVIVELLSYWLAISIIWLVFDLVMYVPLLVHRWLDKGMIE